MTQEENPAAWVSARFTVSNGGGGLLAVGRRIHNRANSKAERTVSVHIRPAKGPAWRFGQLKDARAAMVVCIIGSCEWATYLLVGVSRISVYRSWVPFGKAYLQQGTRPTSVVVSISKRRSQLKNTTR
jgi:hypothetical protein